MTEEDNHACPRRDEGLQIDNQVQACDLIMETVLDTIPNPVFYKDREGRYQGCNLAFAEQITGLPKEAIVGCTLFDLPETIPSHVAEIYANQDAALFETAGTQFYESEVLCADGVRRHFFINKATFLDTRGRPAGIVGVMLDITERKQTEEALRKSEERFRRFFEDTTLGIFQSTENGRILTVNPALARMFGYDTPNSLLAAAGQDASILYDDSVDRDHNIRLVTRSEAPVQIETRYRRRDGTPFMGEFHAWKVRDREGRLLYLEGFIEDISERKQFEQSLRNSERRLRFLSSKLLAAQEEERRRISMELHDDVGQNLAALKLQMRSMSGRLRRDQVDLKEECQNALGFIDRIIDSTRHLSRALSPAVLEDLKLCGTIQWMLRDFKKYASIATCLEMDDIDPLFSHDQQLIIYRILQEGLHNIFKHARARSVSLTARRKTRAVVIQLCDDGCGFDVDRALNRSVAERGLGLAALEERSNMLGGRLVIHSERGHGTSVTLTIPVDESEKHS